MARSLASLFCLVLLVATAYATSSSSTQAATSTTAAVTATTTPGPTTTFTGSAGCTYVTRPLPHGKRALVRFLGNDLGKCTNAYFSIKDPSDSTKTVTFGSSVSNAIITNFMINGTSQKIGVVLTGCGSDGNTNYTCPDSFLTQVSATMKLTCANNIESNCDDRAKQRKNLRAALVSAANLDTEDQIIGDCSRDADCPNDATSPWPCLQAGSMIVQYAAGQASASGLSPDALAQNIVKGVQSGAFAQALGGAITALSFSLGGVVYTVGSPGGAGTTSDTNGNNGVAGGSGSVNGGSGQAQPFFAAASTTVASLSLAFVAVIAALAVLA
jgi:hypothetical protein